MADYGTAPRRISANVWITHTGRRLSTAGARYWESHYQQGRVDERGHVTRPQTVGGRPSLAMKPKPVPVRQGPATAPQKREPGFTPTMQNAPRLARQAADIRRQAALGKISPIEAKERLENMGLIGGRKLTKAEIFPVPHGVGGWGAKLIGGLTMDIAAAPVPIYESIRHPTRAPGIAKKMAIGIGKSYYGMATHPGRMFLGHPDEFLLNLLPAYGAAAKGLVAARAARAGGALAGVKALGRMTPRQVRSVKLGGVELQVPEGATRAEAEAIRQAAQPVEVARFSSRNALTGEILRARDRQMMARLAAEKGARQNVLSPQGGFGRELSRQYNTRLARALAPAQAFERFARGRGRLNPIEEKAVEMVARGFGEGGDTFQRAHLNARSEAINKGLAAEDALAGATDAEALDALQAQRDRWANSAEHHGVHSERASGAADLLQNPTPRLQTVLNEARALMSNRERQFGMSEDQINHSIGKAHDEVLAQAEGRSSLAQRIDEAETKIIGGPETAIHEGKKARVARLQTAYEAAIKQAEIKVEKSRTPRTRMEAEARLAELEHAHENLISEAEQVLKGDAPLDPAETARRNIERIRYRKGKRLTAPKTLAQELRVAAIEHLDNLAEKHKAEPWAKAYMAQRDELGALRTTLQETHPTFGERAAVKGEFGVGAPRRGIYDPTVLRQGAALSIAKDELESYERGLTTRKATSKIAEQEAAALHQQAIDLGAQARERGAFYLPFENHRSMRPAGPSPSRSFLGFGPPRARRVHSLSGEAFRSGLYRTDVARLLADAAREGGRTAVANEYWPKILALSKETEAAAGGKFATPVRLTKEIPPEFREATMRPPHGDLTPQEAADAAHDWRMTVEKWKFPSRAEVDPETGRLANGDEVRWVDRRLISGLLLKERPSATRIGGADVSLGSVFDTINAVPKILTLAKPGYLMNRVQQGIQNLSQQGVFLPASSKFLKRLQHDLDPAELYELQAIAGVGRSRAIAPETGGLKRAVTATADLMGRLTDDTSRMLSLAHELKTAGYDTTGKVRALMRDEGKQVELDAIQTRIRQEAIPFDKMSDVERRTIGRVLFFWPWTRAALEWTARFPGEHPFQAYGYGQMGQYGKERLAGRGAVPEWAQGIIPVGGGRTINLASINTPETVVETGRLLRSLGTRTSPYEGGDTPASEVGPGVAGFYGLLSGTARGRGSYAPYWAAARAMLGTTPLWQMYDRTHKPPTSVYPGSLEGLISPWLGGAYPRVTNMEALAEAGGPSEPSSGPQPRDPATGRFVPRSGPHLPPELSGGGGARTTPTSGPHLPPELR